MALSYDVPWKPLPSIRSSTAPESRIQCVISFLDASVCSARPTFGLSLTVVNDAPQSGGGKCAEHRSIGSKFNTQRVLSKMSGKPLELLGPYQEYNAMVGGCEFPRCYAVVCGSQHQTPAMEACKGILSGSRCRASINTPEP